MSLGSDLLAQAVHEAGKDGDIAAPSEIFTVLTGFEDPVQALADWDRANELFVAFDNEFGFINRVRTTKQPLQPPEFSRYAGLIRWLIRELHEWPSRENAPARLVAALVAAQVCDSENGLWALLPDSIGTNVELIDRLKAVVAGFGVEFTTLGGRPRAAERLAKFKEADARGDWPATIEGWHMFEQQPFFTNTLQTQTVRFLYRYSRDGLVQVLENLRQTVIAMQIAASFSAEQRLRLALASANPYLQLACAYQTVSAGRNVPNLRPDQEQLLSELLLRVADDDPRWAAWMKIFNTYPIRFPRLQPALGLALARVPDRALEPYVQSIRLYPKQTGPDAGRQAVAECLRVFRAHAALERRQSLWTAAHNRWLAWNFDEAEPNQHVLWIVWCELDYALVGYACECMNEAARTRAVEMILNDLRTFDYRWYASDTDRVSAWHRLLSKLQPYAYASNFIQDGGDWLVEKQACWPFDPAKETYLAIKYRMEQPNAIFPV